MNDQTSLFETALALMRAGDVEAVLALAEQPGARSDSGVLNVCATGAMRAGRFAEAEAVYRRAVLADPDAAAAHSNFGLFLQAQGRWDEAEHELAEAVRLQPDVAETQNNLAGLHGRRRRWALAEAGHRQALRLRPDHWGAAFNLGTLLLARGAFEEGWPLYEARRDPRNPAVGPAPAFPFPQWRGESLAGRSLLIWFEQGFGDEIQFARHAAALKAAGAAHVTLICKPELAVLFATLEGVDRLAPATGELQIPVHDYWTPLLSIPYRLGIRLDTIPGATPYLASLAERRARWAEVLPRGFRVGLAWRGAASLGSDAYRSLSGLPVLAPLWSVAGVSFVSLQKGAGQDEAEAPPEGQPIAALGARATDFADTAAIIDQLDLVITVDTAVAHLAGALGKPCWVLLPFVGTDWRWLRGRDDSPWYPSVRLFRQGEHEDWPTVIDRVRRALAEQVRQKD